VRLTGTNLEELVLAIPTNDLWKLLPYKESGLIKGDSNILDRMVRNGLFRKRSELEEDPSFKQIIPYAMISNKESFYLFKRTSGQTEKRLQHKLHLGAGGHVNPGRSNETDAQYLVHELKRELFEEVKFSTGCVIEDIAFIGFINDDSIPVGRAHIGLLYDIRVSSQDIFIHETDKMTAEWIEKKDLAEYYEEMETWTKIAFDYYIK
jgi:predicted NUDIX family phosphoesterase